MNTNDLFAIIMRDCAPFNNFIKKETFVIAYKKKKLRKLKKFPRQQKKKLAKTENENVNNFYV